MNTWDYIQELEYQECCGINKATTFWTQLIFQVIHQTMSAFVQVKDFFDNISCFSFNKKCFPKKKKFLREAKLAQGSKSQEKKNPKLAENLNN